MSGLVQIFDTELWWTKCCHTCAFYTSVRGHFSWLDLLFTSVLMNTQKVSVTFLHLQEDFYSYAVWPSWHCVSLSSTTTSFTGSTSLVSMMTLRLFFSWQQMWCSAASLNLWLTSLAITMLRSTSTTALVVSHPRTLQGLSISWRIMETQQLHMFGSKQVWGQVVVIFLWWQSISILLMLECYPCPKVN